MTSLPVYLFKTFFKLVDARQKAQQAPPVQILQAPPVQILQAPPVQNQQTLQNWITEQSVRTQHDGIMQIQAPGQNEMSRPRGKNRKVMMPNDDIPVHARLGQPNVEPEKVPITALEWIEHFENAMGDGRHEFMKKAVR